MAKQCDLERKSRNILHRDGTAGGEESALFCTAATRPPGTAMCRSRGKGRGSTDTALLTVEEVMSFL